MLTIILIISGLLNLLLITIRVAESIFELKKNPDLDTWGEICQTFVNFFKIETYKK